VPWSSWPRQHIQVYLPMPMDRATLLHVELTILHCPPSMITRQWASVDSKLLGRPRNVSYLARSAKLPTGLYIYLALISFFFTRSKVISVSTGPIFTIFSPNGRYLREFYWSGPVFPIPQGMLPWQPILWQNYLPPCTYRSGIQKRNGITPCICMIK